MKKKLIYISKVGLGLGALMSTQLAIASPKIHEVQPLPIEAPEQLVIWGSNFGDNPEIYFGTHLAPLMVSADQMACADQAANPAPPLDPTEFDCVVVDLPIVNGGEPNVPSGDYLLKIIGESNVNVCGEKPSSLTFMYQPANCDGFNSQEGDICFGDMTGAFGTTNVTATGGNKTQKWAQPNSPIMPGDNVVLTAANGSNWPNELTVNFDENGLSQSISLHTSCSQPLILGEVYGSFQLVDFVGVEGDPLMQR